MAIQRSEFLKQSKGRLVLFLACLLLMPLMLLYTAWLTDFEWWSADHLTGNGENETIFGDTESEAYFENLNYQLKNIRCPARAGLELRDYWDCLWHTSITLEGIQQHRKIIWENYVNKLEEDLKTVRQSRRETLQSKKQKMKRVRRQSDSTPERESRQGEGEGGEGGEGGEEGEGGEDPLSADEHDFLGKGVAINFDILVSNIFFKEDVVKCLYKIYPGVSIQDFLYCQRKPSAQPFPPGYDHLRPGGESIKEPKYQTTTYPPINMTYNSREFPLLEMVNRINTTYKFSLEFQPLGDEEKQSNFFGADPYLDDNFSPYRYRYNNLNFQQRQPSWTYRGLHGSKDWHNLGLDRFLLPMQKSTDLKKEALTSEFAETYPGIGELANQLNLDSPLDYRWNKDSGYTAYTRFLLPLLQKNDLSYYKTKEYTQKKVNETQLLSHEEIIKNILTGLEDFLNRTIESTKFYDADEKVPFYRVYLDFVSHFYNFDMYKYEQLFKRLRKDDEPECAVNQELDTMRILLRAYVQVVENQLFCLKAMIEGQAHRLESEEEIKEIIKNVMKHNVTNHCATASNLSMAINQSRLESLDYPRIKYFVPEDKMSFLYDSFYDRLDARQRYSLPKFPIEFPVCKHNDPSPIDIKTHQGRKSSIRDYTFGGAAYRLNRFFMFFPMDASTLLTVGIVDGERLDDSSVRLTGGAVRGQNLTFQYMHIRYGHKWDMIGSEHWIDGKGASMELQMVFTISGSADYIKYWHVLARVQNQLFQFRDKLVIILAVLVDVLETDQAVKDKINNEKLNQDPYLFEAFAQAAHHFRKMPQINPTYEQPRGYVSADPVFRFIDFIPRKSTNFYTYRGSLSWPPCFGYVLWSVYEQRLYMSKRQFDEFARIPAYGIHTNNYAHDNVRKFEDVYVEEEHDPRLSFYDIEALRTRRTIDRYILTGYHHVDEDGNEDYQDDAIVGEEIYVLQESYGGSAQRSQLVDGVFRNFKNLILVFAVFLIEQLYWLY